MTAADGPNRDVVSAPLISADDAPSPHSPADDLSDIRQKWLAFCSHDTGLPYPCICPTEDHRPVIAALVGEVETLRAEVARLEAERAGPCGDDAAPFVGLGGTPLVRCDLRAGHAGWHEGGEHRTSWTYTTPSDSQDEPRRRDDAHRCGSCLQELHEECSRGGCGCSHATERIPTWESDLLLSQAMTERDKVRAVIDELTSAARAFDSAHAGGTSYATFRAAQRNLRAVIAAVDQMAPSTPPSTPESDGQGEVAVTDAVEAETEAESLTRPFWYREPANDVWLTVNSQGADGLAFVAIPRGEEPAAPHKQYGVVLPRAVARNLALRMLATLGPADA